MQDDVEERKSFMGEYEELIVDYVVDEKYQNRIESCYLPLTGISLRQFIWGTHDEEQTIN